MALKCGVVWKILSQNNPASFQQISIFFNHFLHDGITTAFHLDKVNAL